MHCESLPLFSYFLLLLCSLSYFHFCFYNYCLALSILAVPACATAAFTFASGHSGLEIKILRRMSAKELMFLNCGSREDS